MKKTVDISVKFKPLPLKYFVASDLNREQIDKIVKDFPDYFLFLFYTGTVEEVLDCSDMSDDLKYKRVAKPYYVGNCDNKEQAMVSIMKLWFDGIGKPIKYKDIKL
ncbi:MAG: hypothetical protein KAS30_01645 [Candidatus Diapherotrites archaeon]|nr:hypothetical protein [Candidatus Diapherotrites archaeon]